MTFATTGKARFFTINSHEKCVQIYVNTKRFTKKTVFYKKESANFKEQKNKGHDNSRAFAIVKSVYEINYRRDALPSLHPLRSILSTANSLRYCGTTESRP